MFLFFKTFDNTLLPTGSPAMSNTSSKNFPCTLFGSAYETDTSPLPTTVARSEVFHNPPPPPAPQGIR
ncbi:hypothetical protein L202_04262 [Cryptococcus amylolentus CBS 6039]|uniref:Uncharacterized protein n=1 Tax=Cryptococcus amylolentus CBS 6039 TaxID=1295533 RepID=A0A1E3HQP1_9TREE|nr:hypothetical protein L202_04262 [Cryptococcus amylolentus CBS 6039]ODN78679.1 hypothetical protein L202_04262 [Cryptococcus amylolentus CBS 6039]